MVVGRVLDVKLQKMGRDCVHGQVMLDEQLRPSMDGCNGVQGVVCGATIWWPLYGRLGLVNCRSTDESEFG